MAATAEVDNAPPQSGELWHKVYLVQIRWSDGTQKILKQVSKDTTATEVCEVADNAVLARYMGNVPDHAKTNMQAMRRTAQRQDAREVQECFYFVAGRGDNAMTLGKIRVNFSVPELSATIRE